MKLGKREALIFTLILAVALLGFSNYALSDYHGEEEDELEELRVELLELREEAMAEGDYNCCLENPCIQCLVGMGECPCGENIVEGGPICHECKGAWEAGDGAIEDIDIDEIEVMPRGEEDED